MKKSYVWAIVIATLAAYWSYMIYLVFYWPV